MSFIFYWTCSRRFETNRNGHNFMKLWVFLLFIINVLTYKSYLLTVSKLTLIFSTNSFQWLAIFLSQNIGEYNNNIVIPHRPQYQSYICNRTLGKQHSINIFLYILILVFASICLNNDFCDSIVYWTSGRVSYSNFKLTIS